VSVPLPVEPMFDLALLPQLIPCEPGALKGHLQVYKRFYEPAYYRITSVPGSRTRHHRRRLFPASQVRAIRERMIRRGKVASG